MVDKFACTPQWGRLAPSLCISHSSKSDIHEIIMNPLDGLKKLLSREIQRFVSARGVFPVMSFTTFKLMHTSQRIPPHISILVFTSEMT